MRHTEEVKQLREENARLAVELAVLREENEHVWWAYELSCGDPWQGMPEHHGRWMRELATCRTPLLKDAERRRIEDGTSAFTEMVRAERAEDARRLKPEFSQRCAPPGLRMRVLERDGYRCVSCGVAKKLVCDHIIPWAKGGKTVLENLQTLCRKCNGIKGDLMPDEWEALRGEHDLIGVTRRDGETH